MFAAPRASAVLHYWCKSYIPLKQRIHFKILLFAFKAIHGIAPTYIQKSVSLKSFFFPFIDKTHITVAKFKTKRKYITILQIGSKLHKDEKK